MTTVKSSPCIFCFKCIQPSPSPPRRCNDRPRSSCFADQILRIRWLRKIFFQQGIILNYFFNDTFNPEKRSRSILLENEMKTRALYVVRRPRVKRTVCFNSMGRRIFRKIRWIRLISKVEWEKWKGKERIEELLHLRHPPRGVARYPGPDYDTLPCRFISKPAGRLSTRATQTTDPTSRALKPVSRASFVWMSRRIISPGDELSRRASNYSRPFDKREISLGQFGTIRTASSSKIESTIRESCPELLRRLTS